MDFADQASEREMADRELALAEQLATGSSGGSYSHCKSCGGEIPIERQKAVPGVTLCTACQAAKERQKRGRA